MSVQQKIIPSSIRGFILKQAFRLFVRPTFKADPTNLSIIKKVARTFLDKLALFPTGTTLKKTLHGKIPAYLVNIAGQEDCDHVILYLHGGAFMLETPNLHGAFLSRLVKKTGCKGLMPSYRLAPEHPFPAAVDDVVDFYRELLTQGLDPTKIILAGDSAGACLALVLLMQAQRLNFPSPACAVLISPCTNMKGDTASFTTNMGLDPMFNKNVTRYTDKFYLSNDATLFEDERVSPLLGEFKGLPPLYFSVGSTELLLDDSVLAAEKAQRAGVDTQCTVWKNMPHCFPIMPPAYLPEAKIALDEISDFIKVHMI